MQIFNKKDLYVYSKQEKKALLSLGQMIKKRRLDVNLSQAQLAFEINTDGRHIRRIENGEINPSFLTLKKIADALYLDLNELIKSKE